MQYAVFKTIPLDDNFRKLRVEAWIINLLPTGYQLDFDSYLSN
jgi:hypothetical protein